MNVRISNRLKIGYWDSVVKFINQHLNVIYVFILLA